MIVEVWTLLDPFDKALTGLLWTVNPRNIADALNNIGPAAFTPDERAALVNQFASVWTQLDDLLRVETQDHDPDDMENPGAMYHRVQRYDEDQRRILKALLWEICVGLRRAFEAAHPQ